MKILIVTDRPKSAISILAVDQQKYTPQHDITICPVHPKKAGRDQLRMVDAYGQACDVVHVGYWRSGEVLRQFPWFAAKPKVLVHHNPYDLEAGDWSDYDAVVVKNKTQAKALPNVVVIPHCIDFETFTWEDEGDAPVVGMVAGRIEASKGIAPVAQACGELGYRFLLVGRLPGGYINEVEREAQGQLDFREDVSVRELVEAYHEMHVLVVNSKDGFESGPLPALEAMACGTPVLTRNVGMIPDIFNGENLVVRNGCPGDAEDLERNLQALMEDKAKRDRLRIAGYRTVANRPTQVAARMYSLLYHRVAYPTLPLVSVVIPTRDRGDTLPLVLDSVEAQNYEHIEVVVCDDGSQDQTAGVVRAHQRRSKHTVKYVNTGGGGYGLAKARNMGVVEAEGEYVMFLDDRLMVKPDAVERFLTALRKGAGWVWGVKNDKPKGFVENFSAVRRDMVIKGGMFCERAEFYGALTRETHRRFSHLGVSFKRVDDARAYEVRSSRGWKGRKGDLVKARELLFKLYGG